MNTKEQLTLEHTAHGWTDLFATIKILIEKDYGLKIELTKSNILEPGSAIMNILEDSSIRFAHPLQRGLHRTRGGKNSLRTFFYIIINQLFPYLKKEDGSICNDYEFYSKEYKRLFLFFQNAQNLFIESLDQKHVKKARKFPYCRWDYYKYFKEHSHPRVEQLVTSCPGLISILCITKKEKTISIEEHDQILKMVTEGVPLKIILHRVFDLLYHSEHEYWKDFRNYSSSRKNSACNDWIWTVLNASTCTGANYLIYPPPVYICKSDLPSKNRARADWIKRTKMFGMMVIPEKSPEIHIEQIKGLILMISKSENNSYKYLNKRRTCLKEFFREKKIYPNSKTNCSHFFRKVQKFHKNKKAEEEKLENLEFKLAKSKITENNGVIHDQDFELKVDQVSIRALTTMDDLKNESKKMKNCVKSQWFEAFNKKYIHFHVEIEKTQYTLSINPSTLDILDFKGVKNSEVEDEHIEILGDVYFQNLNLFEEFFVSNL